MWLACANSLAAEIGQPEGDRKAADMGSDKHELLTLCLQFNKMAIDYLGHTLKYGHTVNNEIAGDVQIVLDNVRERISSYELRGCTVQIELEQRVPIDHITGEKDATGTADIVLIVSWPDGHATIDVIDAKFGYQEVIAEENTQLMMYGSGALEKFGLVEDFTEVTLVIEQPLRGSSEWTTNPGHIENWVLDIAFPAAQKALAIHYLVSFEKGYAVEADNYNPTEKGCQWCKAYAVCRAAKAHVEDTIGASFEAISEGEDKPWNPAELESMTLLGSLFPQLELIEDWIKAVRARVELELLAGKQIPGLKLVAGKRGNRAWASDDEAEALMKKFKLKQEQIYSFKLLGPKPILEVLKDQPRRLKQIEALIVQPQGKPHVALDSDKRPALEIKPVEDGFDTVDELC
jgi:hypothetical protein